MKIGKLPLPLRKVIILSFFLRKTLKKNIFLSSRMKQNRCCRQIFGKWAGIPCCRTNVLVMIVRVISAKRSLEKFQKKIEML